MRAAIYTGPNQIEVRDFADPSPKEGEGLVKVKYAGICGTDLTILSGKHPRVKPPHVFGHEFCGELVEIDDPFQKSNLKIGDRVVVFPLIPCHQCLACRTGNEHICRRLRMIGIDRDGGMAEYVSVSLQLLIKIEKEIDSVVGALIEPFAVTIHAARKSNVKIGDKVLVIGAGPIGFLLVLLLRYSGIDNLIISEINPFRRKILSNSGFEVIDPEKENIIQRILKFTHGEGVDVAFEVSGATSAALQVSELMRPGGKIILASVFKEPTLINLRAINFKEISLEGTRVYTYLDFTRAIELASSNRIPLKKVITHHILLEKVRYGFQLLKKQKETLKVIIDCQRR